MTNTYMLPGRYEHDEIIASVDKGLYAVNFGGGQVDITSGKFVFSASEAYLVEGGKVTRPVKGATLIGNGPGCAHPREHGRRQSWSSTGASACAGRKARACRWGSVSRRCGWTG